ncbi:hypothetical protein [Halorhabdus rudnickae]|uniref:hypothetical protein n=1 Tax=Halorhabdus rudnickae TaxID=1775544 RepID=UPI001082C01E|nr:hypothetical protein [Halorhabdus rudnickae]
MGESGRDPVDTKNELNLLQQRLQNKTQNIGRIIQFNIISLSIVAGFLQLGDLSDVGWNLITISGVSIVALSIFLAVFGMTLSRASFAWMTKKPSESASKQMVLHEYRTRNRYLGWIVAGSIGAGGFGIATMLVGVFRAVEIEPIFPWWVSESIVLVTLVGSALLGYWFARRIRTDISE